VLLVAWTTVLNNDALLAVSEGAVREVHVLLSKELSRANDAVPAAAAFFPQMMEKVLPAGMVSCRSNVTEPRSTENIALVASGAFKMFAVLVTFDEVITASAYCLENAGTRLVRSSKPELEHSVAGAFQFDGFNDQ
jgi:hypothetical protein